MAASHVHAPDPKDVESALRALRELTVQQALTSTAIRQAKRNGPAELADDTDPAPSIVPPEPAIDQNEEIGVEDPPTVRRSLAALLSLLPLVCHGKPTAMIKPRLWSKPCGHQFMA